MSASGISISSSNSISISGSDSSEAIATLDFSSNGNANEAATNVFQNLQTTLGSVGKSNVGNDILDSLKVTMHNLLNPTTVAYLKEFSTMLLAANIISGIVLILFLVTKEVQSLDENNQQQTSSRSMGLRDNIDKILKSMPKIITSLKNSMS